MKRILYVLTILALLTTILTTCKTEVAVTGVKLNKTALTLGTGNTETLIATVSPEKATNKAVVFTSSNPLVATVMPNGLVTALSKGEATIVVTTVDGNFTADCKVKVEDIPVTDVKLNKNTLILDVDETETLIATVLPENATNKAVLWTSSNPAVANVVLGTVHPVSRGKAVITVSTLDGAKTAKCDLEVIKKVHVTGVELNKTSLEIGVGNDEQLTASVLPNNATNKNVTWSSSNPAAVTVSNTGLVSAITEGTSAITVTTEEGNFTATCNVKSVNYTSPVVITLEAIIIDADERIAKFRGNITNIGDPPYTEKGFIFAIAPFDPLEPHPSPATIKVIVGGNGIGIFETEARDAYFLDLNIRAYAKTSLGTVYGDIVTLSFE